MEIEAPRGHSEPYMLLSFLCGAMALFYDPLKKGLTCFAKKIAIHRSNKSKICTNK